MTIIKKRIVFFMMALLTGLLLTTAFQPFAQAVESPTISTPAAIQGLDEYQPVQQEPSLSMKMPHSRMGTRKKPSIW